MDLSDLNQFFDRQEHFNKDLGQKLSGLRSSRFEKFLENSRNTDLWPSLKSVRESAPCSWQVRDGGICITSATQFLSQGPDFEATLRPYMPWKKGPFSFDEIKVDAEWRSDLKWQRLLPHIPEMEDKVIADIGANNGYFMFRMAEHKPKLVLGIEPAAKAWANFWFIQSLINVPNLSMEPTDLNDFTVFEKFFDVIFFMGVIYHHPDPFGVLKILHRALKPGGTLILESQGIIGDESVALVPRGRYANARGIYYLPTQACLETWLHRCSFRDIECFANIKLDVSEQRSTPWAPIKSLAEFLDPADSSKTIEGHPAPHRIYLKSVRAR